MGSKWQPANELKIDARVRDSGFPQMRVSTEEYLWSVPKKINDATMRILKTMVIING